MLGVRALPCQRRAATGVEYTSESSLHPQSKVGALGTHTVALQGVAQLG